MKKILTKLGLAGGSIVAVLLGAILVSGFEASIVNVTARIENALSVDTKALDFGTVFPQEYMKLPINVTLSDSFLAEDRVDDVEYVIKQKPKVKLDSCVLDLKTAIIDETPACDPNQNPTPGDPNLQITVGNFTGPAWQYCEENLPEDADKQDNIGYTVNLSDEYWKHCYLPLANSLSKHEDTLDGTETENDTSIDAFHQAYLWAGNPVKSSLDPQFIAKGRLAKSVLDTQDKWIIDLKVPCFYGMCAQEADDVANLVDDETPGFHVPVPFRLDPKTEHKVFGTDLWIEVTEISLPPTGPTPTPTPTITVTPTPTPTPTSTPTPTPTPTPNGELVIQKVIVDPNQLGTKQVSDFAFTIDSAGNFPAGNHQVTAGQHTVAEINSFGYTTTYSGSCDANGVITVPSGGSATCTVTNTQPFGTITINKVVTNNNGGNAVIGDFQLFANGTSMTSSTPKNFVPGTYTISELGVNGYAASFSGDCDPSSHEIVLASGENKVCTITNDDISPVITLIKSVTNDNGGTATPNQFLLRVNATAVPTGSSLAVNANTNHTINEDAKAGYTFQSLTGSGCPATLGGTVNLAPGQSITCTITNNDNPPV